MGVPNLTGMLFCYRTRKEMIDVYDRMKALELSEVGIEKAYNQHKEEQNKWVIIVLGKDKIKLDEVYDEVLVNVDTGDAKKYFAEFGEFFGEMLILGKYEPGFIKIQEGYCPANAKSPMACTFCMFGHALECHHPMICEDAKCSHLSKYMEE